MKEELNYEKVYNTLVNETTNYIVSNGLKAMVIGISGGIDSTVTAAICHAVSKKTGIPLIGRSLPIKNKPEEYDAAELVGRAFCNDFKTVYLKDSYFRIVDDIVGWEQGFTEYGDLVEDTKQTPIANGNIQARLRMIYLYNLASIHNGLVMSTDNQTEYQIGFWTLHGDVGDFGPIQDLWKTEVYGLAQWIHDYHCMISDGHDTDKLNALKQSIALTPTDGLGISNSDLEQIGAKSYYDVDRVLQTLVCKASPENDKLQDSLEQELGREVVHRIIKRHTASEFKRKTSPIDIPRKKYEGIA